MIIFPAIDILESKVVRLEKGDYKKYKIYADDPSEKAVEFENNKMEWLHMVDLEASKSGKISALPVIQKIKSKTSLKIQFGGGVRSLDNVIELLEKGVDRVIIGSISLKNKSEFEKIIDSVGNDKIVVAADVRNENIAVKGWTEDTETSVFNHIEYCMSKGITNFLITDISKDGMLEGPNFELYDKIQNRFLKINIIVSGGISSIQEVYKVKDKKYYGVITGKAIYENKIKLEELKEVVS